MKKLILTVLIALTASSSFADSILLENNESYWHGEKRMSEGKLQCLYYEMRNDTHYRNWHDSYQTGTTPVCPPHLEYILWRWWTGEDSKGDWNNWKKTHDWGQYEAIKETEDFIKTQGYQRTNMGNGEHTYSVFTPYALEYLKKVRLGYAEAYTTFIQNGIEKGQITESDITDPNYWLKQNYDGEEARNYNIFNLHYSQLPKPRDFR